MTDYRLGEVEMKFADIIWEMEPLSSGELVKHAENKLDWKKSTTYTILRRLCDRGIFRNENGKVSSIISKEEFQAAQSENFISENFSGSLPKFLAAFSTRKKLSEKEILEIQKIINNN